MDRFKLKPAVHLFLIKNNKVLLLKRKNTNYMDGYYSVPAGHMDGNETATEAVIREALEEAGVRLTANELTMSHVMHRMSEEERIDFFFTAFDWQGEVTNTEPEKCEELLWIPFDNIPKNTIPYIKKALECFHCNQTYSEFGWKVADKE